MPKTRGSFKKGEGGRRKGVPNRTTKEARELLEKILFGQIDNINESLNNIRESSEDRYLDAMAKLFRYVLPQKTDVTSEGERLFPKMPTVIIQTKNGSQD